MILTLDLETSIHNKGNPFDQRNFIVSAHIKRADQPTTCHFYDEPDFATILRKSVAAASLFIGVNCKFDLSWLLYERKIRVPSSCRIWDCMLAEFILSGQTAPFTSLAQLAEKYGLEAKGSLDDYWDKGISTENIPRDVVSEYGNLDTSLSYAVYLAQQSDPRMSPELHKLILLDGLDLLVLLDMECNGFKYNVAGSLKKAELLLKELNEVDEELYSFSPTRFNLDSGDWLSCFLYGGTIEEDVFKPVDRIYQGGPNKGAAYVRNEWQRTDKYVFPQLFVPLKGTALKKEGFYSTAEDVLIQLKARTKEQRRIVALLNRRAFISKLCGTYLVAMPTLIELMHWEDETIHGQFNQVVARTGRLSSSRPNMQNAPEDVDEFFVTRFN